MAAPYILARTMGEAHQFAQEELGIGRGYYRVVTSPSSVKGPRGADLYLLPGWQGRFDRFAMQGALKWTRLNKIDVAEWRAARDAESETVSEPDNLEPAGEQYAILPPEAQQALDDFEVRIEPEGWEPPETLNAEQILRLAAGESGAEVAPMEEREAEEPKRRRRRCKECGVLVEPDDVESHAADHASDLVSLGRQTDDGEV